MDRPLGAAAVVLAAVATLAIGGVHPATQVALGVGTLALVVGYLASRGRTGARIVPFTALFACAAGATLLQLLPLPAPLVELLSPAAYQIRRAAVRAAGGCR